MLLMGEPWRSAGYGEHALALSLANSYQGAPLVVAHESESRPRTEHCLLKKTAGLFFKRLDRKSVV